MDWDSSTVTTPSLPTLSMAPHDHLADLWVAGGNGCHLRDFRRRVHRRCALHQLFDGLFRRRSDTAVQLNWVGTSGNVAQALEDERLGEQGCGGGAVTGDVVGLHGHGLHQLCTEVLKRLLDVDVTGDGHAVVGDGGAAEGLGQHNVAAAGAEGDLDCVSKRVNAALDALASFLVKCNQLWHEGLLLDDCEQVTCRQQEVLLAVVLQLGAAVLGEDDGVALVDANRNDLALVIGAAWADGDDGSLLRLFLSGVWDNQAGSGGGFCFYDLDENLVLKWLDVCHGDSSEI